MDPSAPIGALKAKARREEILLLLLKKVAGFWSRQSILASHVLLTQSQSPIINATLSVIVMKALKALRVPNSRKIAISMKKKATILLRDACERKIFMNHHLAEVE
jgi:hypothetical protein